MAPTSPHAAETECNAQISAALVAHFGDRHAAEIQEAIGPIIADDAFAKATYLLARIFDGLRLAPKGEALLYLLGLPFTNGSIRAAARAIGCSPQAIEYHVKALGPFINDLHQASNKRRAVLHNAMSSAQIKRNKLTRPQVCTLMGISDVTLAKLDRRALKSEGLNGSRQYKRADCMRLIQLKLQRECTWADIAAGKCSTRNNSANK